MTPLDALGKEIDFGRLALMPSVAEASRLLGAESPSTCRHCEAVGALSEMIAKEMGLTAEQCTAALAAGLVHDLGKVLDKGILRLVEGSSPLSEVDRIRVNLHPALAAKHFMSQRLNQDIVRAILTHHERPDGKGYHGFSGGQFPLLGRIVAVADFVHACTAEVGRDYRKQPLSADAVWHDLRKGAGTQFDGDVVGALESVSKNTLIF